MAYDLIEASDKIDYLENIMAQLANNVNQVSVNVARLSHEMQEFKGEMRVFRNKMETAIHHVQQETVKSNQKLDGIIRNIQQSTPEFKRKVAHEISMEEMRAESRKLDQHLAKHSDKMGTMAEDMVAPKIPLILKEMVGCRDEMDMIGVRAHRRLPDGRSQRYDVVATCENYVVLNETKSYLRPEDLPAFRELLEQAHDFFPEYAGRQFIGILATYQVDPIAIAAGEQQGFIMLGVINGLMEILNHEGFIPTTF